METIRHPLVSNDAVTGKPSYPAYDMFCVVIGVLIASSAYPVYHNILRELPISVSFFWFSLFAVPAAFLCPNDLTSALFTRSLSLKQRWHLLYPGSPLILWCQSLRQGGIRWIILAGFTSVLNFICLLSSLQVRQTGVVMTVLVLQQISPLLAAWFGFRFLGDTCKNWNAYVIGIVITTIGVILYKCGLTVVVFFDRILWLVVMIIVLDSVSVTARAGYRRHFGVDALQAVRTIQIMSVVAGFVWMTWNHAIHIPSATDLIALAYLGFVPTALASIVVNRAQDRIGIPATKSIGSLRPMFILLFGFTPLAWFHVPLKHLTFLNYVGIGIAVIGLLIVFCIAKPKPVRGGENPRCQNIKILVI